MPSSSIDKLKLLIQDPAIHALLADIVSGRQQAHAVWQMEKQAWVLRPWAFYLVARGNRTYTTRGDVLQLSVAETARIVFGLPPKKLPAQFGRMLQGLGLLWPLAGISKKGPGKRFRLGKANQELEALLEELRSSAPASSAVPPAASARVAHGVPAAGTIDQQAIDLVAQNAALEARVAELTEQNAKLKLQLGGVIGISNGYEAVLGNVLKLIRDVIP